MSTLTETIVSERSFESLFPLLITVNVYLPELSACGTPDITPFDESDSPEGRVGETLQVNPSTPLMALSFAEYGWDIPSEGACAMGSEFVAIARFAELAVGVSADEGRL
jgi:hypothetical protein